MFSGYAYAYVFQQCVDTYYYDDMLRNCANQSQVYGYNYFFEGGQCCYSYQDYYAVLKSCFCASDYCNNYILEPPVQTNDSTSTTPWLSYSTSAPANNSGFVNCYSCWYSGNASDILTNLTCEEPFVSYEGNSCGGDACATYASASEGNYSSYDSIEFYIGLCTNSGYHQSSSNEDYINFLSNCLLHRII